VPAEFAPFTIPAQWTLNGPAGDLDKSQGSPRSSGGPRSDASAPSPRPRTVHVQTGSRRRPQGDPKKPSVEPARALGRTRGTPQRVTPRSRTWPGLARMRDRRPLSDDLRRPGQSVVRESAPKAVLKSHNARQGNVANALPSSTLVIKAAHGLHCRSRQMPDRWRPSGPRGTRDGLGRGSPRGAREERDNSFAHERSQMPARPTIERAHHQASASSAEPRQSRRVIESTAQRDVVPSGGAHCLDDERRSRWKPRRIFSGLSRDHRPRCQPPPVIPRDVPAPPRSITVQPDLDALREIVWVVGGNACPRRGHRDGVVRSRWRYGAAVDPRPDIVRGLSDPFAFPLAARTSRSGAGGRAETARDVRNSARSLRGSGHGTKAGGRAMVHN
jgi:hypothetical protein